MCRSTASFASGGQSFDFSLSDLATASSLLSITRLPNGPENSLRVTVIAL